MKIVYTKLASKMHKTNINQKELAKMMHISPSALNRRMTGRGVWNFYEIKQLCKIFDCTFEELF